MRLAFISHQFFLILMPKLQHIKLSNMQWCLGRCYKQYLYQLHGLQQYIFYRNVKRQLWYVMCTLHLILSYLHRLNWLHRLSTKFLCCDCKQSRLLPTVPSLMLNVHLTRLYLLSEGLLFYSFGGCRSKLIHLHPMLTM